MENTPDTAALADQIVSLSDDLARHRLEFQAAESSLVTRIADVDDDRRLTTNRLQRAWQTHREEIDSRLKHQASVFVGALLMVAALLGGALFFAYGQLDTARRILLEDVVRLRADYEQLAAVTSYDAALQESLAGLRASVAAMSESLPPRAEAKEPQAATAGSASTDQGPAGLAPEPTDETEPTEPTEPTPDNIASTAEEIPSTPLEDASAPIAQALPEVAASPSATTIRDEITPTLPKTAENLAGHDAEPAPDPAPTDDPYPAIENAPPRSIEPAARTLETDIEPMQAVSARILDEPLTVGDTPFALQLIGFYSLDDLLDFARREALPSRVYFREESYQGRPWFVLIHGLHARYSDASAAIESLPKELAILDTWIRNFPPETKLGILDIER